MLMENNSPIEDLNENLKEYLSTRYDLMVLKASEKVSIIGAIASVSAVLGILVILFILFISVSAGFFLSDLTGSYSTGFLLLSSIFLLIFALIFIVRKRWIINPIKNRLIREMFDDK